jgi:hypothetical protein
MKENQTFTEWLANYHKVRNTAKLVRDLDYMRKDDEEIKRAARQLQDFRSKQSEVVRRARRGTPPYNLWLEKYLSQFPKVKEKVDRGEISKKEGLAEISEARKKFKEDLLDKHLTEEMNFAGDPLSKSLLFNNNHFNSLKGDVREEAIERWDNRILSSIKDSDYDSIMEGKEERPEFNGREAKIFLDEDNNFIKVVETGESLRDFLIDKVYTHNILFPETEYKILGLVKDPYTGAPSVVLKQKYVEGEILNDETMGEFVTWMEDKGFVGDGYNWTLGSIEITDTREENVLKGKNGEFYIIDPEISVNPDSFR